MGTIWSGWIWILMAISLGGLALFWFLNRLYYIESWFKAICFLLISAGIIGSVIILISNNQPQFLSEIQENMDKMTDDEDQTEEPEILQANAVSENKETANAEEALNKAHQMRQKIFNIINNDIKPRQEEVETKIEERKKKKKDTYTYDSLKLSIETHELLLGTRYEFIAEDIKNYQKGLLEPQLFSQNIDQFATDVDSINAIYGSNKIH